MRCGHSCCCLGPEARRFCCAGADGLASGRSFGSARRFSPGSASHAASVRIARLKVAPPGTTVPSRPIAVFVRCSYLPLGQSSCSSHRARSCAANLAPCCSCRASHNWTLNPFQLMAVSGILGALRCVCHHGATVEETRCWIRSDRPLLRRFEPDAGRKPTRWCGEPISGPRSSGCVSTKRWLHFFMLFVPVMGLWTSSIGHQLAWR